MKDNTRHNRHWSREEPDNSSERTTVSYSPDQRRMYLEGLRAWARVAVRSYAKRRGAPRKCPGTPGGDGQAAEADLREREED